MQGKTRSRPTILAVCGPSAGGKTFLAEYLATRAAGERVRSMPLDAFYHDLARLAPQDREAWDFDRPEALEWPLLLERIALLSTGRPAEVPVYDFTTHARRPESRFVEPTEILVVEGLFAGDPRLRDIADLLVYVDVSSETALERRIARDMRERGRDEESVRRQFRDQVEPAARQYIEPARELADLVVDGAGPVSVAADRVGVELSRRFVNTDSREWGFSRADVLAELARHYIPVTGAAAFRSRLRSWWKRLAWRAVLGTTGLLKRAIDVAGALLLMIGLGPVFLITAAVVRLVDGGPVFFVQKRVGRYGREFSFPKFRSMAPGAEGRREELRPLSDHTDPRSFKMKRDPRITPVGRVIRKLSIDELPQLWCVLKGDMSLVGPRPPLPDEVAAYRLADRRRLDVKPGLTGMWQVGGRGNLAFPQQVALDVLYIESHSLWLDLVLLARTVPAVLLGRGAY